MEIIANGGLVTHNQANTLEAILLAVEASDTDGVLIDLRLSKDNKIVVIEVEDLSMVTMGKGLVSEKNYDDLRKVKFSSKVFKYFIPTLDEVLVRYKNKKKLILSLHTVENDKNLIFVKELEKSIGNFPLLDIYIETDNIDLLEYLIEYLNQYKIGLKSNTLPSSNYSNVDFYDIKYDGYNQRVINYLNNKIMMAFGVNSKIEYNILKETVEDIIKTMYLISDNPLLIKKISINDIM